METAALSLDMLTTPLATDVLHVTPAWPVISSWKLLVMDTDSLSLLRSVIVDAAASF